MSEFARIWQLRFGGGAEQDCACAEEGGEPVVDRLVAGCDVESDCACAVAEPWPDAGVDAAGGLWRRAGELHVTPVDAGHVAAFNAARPAGIALLNLSAQALLDDYAAPRPLRRVEADRRLAAFGALERVGGETTLEAAPRARTLTAWLHVTNQCNLNCRYCYVSQTPETMDPATGDTALGALVDEATRHDFAGLKLKYAGGEPTLNFALVRHLHRVARELTAAAGLELHEVLLTNGLRLTEDMLAFLRDSDMRLMISLDGVGVVNDRQRAPGRGVGASEVVIERIRQALALGLKPHLSITITALNAGEISEVIEFALEHDLPFNLNFYRANQGQPDLRPSDAALTQTMRDVLGAIYARPSGAHLANVSFDRLALDAPRAHACGAGSSYVVVDSRGRVTRCHMQLQQPVTDVASNDILGIIQREDDSFHSLPVTQRLDCGTCAWRHWCAGGCPLDTFRAEGRWDGKSPYCAVYQAILPEMLRLASLRVLREAPLPH